MVYLLWLRLFALLVVTGGRLAALPEPHLSHEAQWTAFKTEFNKTYPSPAEHDQRKLIFLQNLAEIEQHNSEYNLSNPNAPHYKLGINEFSDWSAEEFTSRMYGTFQPANFTPTLVEPAESLPQDLEDLPEELDLREKGYVTEVKHQGNCRSCYAFSAVGALEGQVFKATKKLVSLSAQNIVDCSKKIWNNGCSNGTLKGTFEYVKRKGIATEKDYPYEGKEGPCRLHRKGNLPKFVGYNHVKGELGLMRALNKTGPISFLYFGSYEKLARLKDEVLNFDPECKNNGELNHAMLLVGYGVQDGQKYWLIKNSWGKSWGDAGYGKILRGKNLCHIEDYGYYPVLADVHTTSANISDVD